MSIQNYYGDLIDISKSIKDSKKLALPYQQDAVNALDEYYDFETDDLGAQSGMIVMPTGDRVIIVTGRRNAVNKRVSVA